MSAFTASGDILTLPVDPGTMNSFVQVHRARTLSRFELSFELMNNDFLMAISPSLSGPSPAVIFRDRQVFTPGTGLPIRGDLQPFLSGPEI